MKPFTSENDPCAIVECHGRKKWWRRCGDKRRGFRYLDSQGTPLLEEKRLARIRSLVIPPAWSEVRIAPSPRSHLQAVGLDTTGRIQYLYHPKFVDEQQRKKYEKLAQFGARLPLLRRMTNAHIALDGLPKERVLAVIIRLINDLYFRLGSEASVSQYRTYGVTTLRNRHLQILPGGRLAFSFIGKHHIPQRRLLVDEELAALMAEIKALRGSHLFHYLDENGKSRPITGRDVNQYIKTAVGAEYSAKDFRTWGGTLNAAIVLAELGPAETEKQRQRNIVQATKRVAEQLGNTPAVCRASYIHPVVFERYAQGITLSDFRKKAERIIRRQQPEYEVEELALLALFRAGENIADRGAA